MRSGRRKTTAREARKKFLCVLRASSAPSALNLPSCHPAGNTYRAQLLSLYPVRKIQLTITRQAKKNASVAPRLMATRTSAVP